MRITLPTGTPAEFAQAEGGSRRGLVLIPDVGGLRPLFDDHCARIAAEWRMSVCAPEPFPGREHLGVGERLEAMRELTDASKIADITAAADRTGAEAVYVMGFCMGGMYALKAAAQPIFNRVVSFYGMIRVPERWRDGGQREPLELLRDRGASHVLALIGGRDQWTPPQDVEALRELGAEVVVYPEGEHGFAHDPDRPAHRADDAADAWRRAQEWLIGSE